MSQQTKIKTHIHDQFSLVQRVKSSLFGLYLLNLVRHLVIKFDNLYCANLHSKLKENSSKLHKNVLNK